MTKILNDNLIKNSAIIAISNKISLLQRKLFNYLIANAYIFLKEKDTFEIGINDLKYIVWFDSKNIAYLKESLKLLISTVVEFNLLWKDKDSWSATSLLSSVEFENWKCIYSFSPVLRKKLHQPNIYWKIKLSMMKLFSSKYSLCLYEIFVDYNNIWQTPIIPLEDFRKLMWVKENQYREFKRLSLRVIKPALKELNTIWGYDVRIEYKRLNRKVVALKFLFRPIQEAKKALLEEKVVSNQSLQKKLINDFWLSLRQAQKTIQIYPIPYIKESLEIIKLKISQKSIRNIPAYTVTVLKNDYVWIQTNTTWTNLKKQSLLWDSKKSWQNGKTKMALSKDTSVNVLPCNSDSSSVRKNQKKAFEYFQSLNKEKQDELIKIFENEKITGDILKTLYKKGGVSSILFKSMFITFLISMQQM